MAQQEPLPCGAAVASAGTIHLLHDDPDIQARLENLASERGYRVQQYASVDLSRYGYDSKEPGCLVADFDRLSRDGLSRLFETQDFDPQACPLICLYRSASTSDAKLAMRRGALTLMPVDGEWQELSAYVGVGMSLSRIAHDQRFGRRGSDELDQQLSDREAEVLAHVAMGLSSRQIAESLRISARTVESHRGNMLRKLDVGSTAELLRHYYYSLND